MILTRRQFLKAASALVAAPAIVKADNLMKIYVPPTDIEPLPYRGHFRVPDLRGHYATRPAPLNIHDQRPMEAVEEWAQQNEIRDDWADRYQTSIRTQYVNQAGAAINRKIEDEMFAKLVHKPAIQGQEITGVWMDEAVSMQHLIKQQTGEIIITTGPVPGCIPCDGRELSAIEYPHLYQVLGNKYG